MISYENLGMSVAYYRTYGFQPLDLSWTASKQAIQATFQNPPVFCDFGALVGSAEQSFLQAVLENKINKGNYQAVTPCFRNDAVDDLHQKTFMKNELFCNDNVSLALLKETVQTAMRFFYLFVPCHLVPIDTLSFDICDDKFGIELGSYGVRQHKTFGKWIYATGCAEPRLSYVASLYENQNE